MAAPSAVSRAAALLVGRLGDTIVAVPFLRALRARYPEAKITLVGSASCAGLAPLIAFIDEFRGVGKLKDLPQTAGSAAWLGLAGRDLLVDLNPSFSKTAAGLTALARSRYKLGFSKGRWDGIFTETAGAAGEREHMLDSYARLAEKIGADYDPRLELRIPEPDEREAERIISAQAQEKTGIRVLIFPGNFKKYENRWPEEKFITLTENLLKITGLSVFYLAGPGEEGPVKGIIERLSRPVPLLGPAPLGVTAALLKRMHLCVLNITGTTHLAAAVGAKTFGFYCGYTDAVWRLRGPDHSGVVSESWESCRDIPVEKAWSALKNRLAPLGRL